MVHSRNWIRGSRDGDPVQPSHNRRRVRRAICRALRFERKRRSSPLQTRRVSIPSCCRVRTLATPNASPAQAGSERAADRAELERWYPLGRPDLNSKTARAWRRRWVAPDRCDRAIHQRGSRRVGSLAVIFGAAERGRGSRLSPRTSAALRHHREQTRPRRPCRTAAGSARVVALRGTPGLRTGHARHRPSRRGGLAPRQERHLAPPPGSTGHGLIATVVGRRQATACTARASRPTSSAATWPAISRAHALLVPRHPAGRSPFRAGALRRGREPDVASRSAGAWAGTVPGKSAARPASIVNSVQAYISKIVKAGLREA